MYQVFNGTVIMIAIKKGPPNVLINKILIKVEQI